MSKIQSILFDKDLYTLQDAVDFLISHNFKHNKVDIKDQYLRFRQITPKKSYNYITKEITKGIKFIIVV